MAYDPIEDEPLHDCREAACDECERCLDCHAHEPWCHEPPWLDEGAEPEAPPTLRVALTGAAARLTAAAIVLQACGVPVWAAFAEHAREAYALLGEEEIFCRPMPFHARATLFPVAGACP